MRSLHDFANRLWKGELGAAGAALDVAMAPAAILFDATSAMRNVLYDTGAFPSTKLDVPVISIGNIAVGGTGKTPVTAWLARALRDGGLAPAVLHGGYADDEPALHREMNPDIPVIVGRDRVASARNAVRMGSNIILLDDGFQHRRIQRDMDIVLIAAETWMQDRHVLPRGPWREDERALHRAHTVVITRRTATTEQARAVKDVLRMHLGESGPRIASLTLLARDWMRDGKPTSVPSEPALLVTAIATPDAFLSNATSAGAQVREHVYFPDHHDYSSEDVKHIMKRATDGPIVTTAKDWVKLRSLLPSDRVWVLSQRMAPEEGMDALVDAARNLLP